MLTRGMEWHFPLAHTTVSRPDPFPLHDDDVAGARALAYLHTCEALYDTRPLVILVMAGTVRRGSCLTTLALPC
jgi:hypothetical protein